LPPQSRLKKIAREGFNILLLVAVLYFVARAIKTNWVQVRQRAFLLNWGWIMLSVMFYSGFLFCNSLVWRFVMGRLGDRASIAAFFRAYISALFGRYVPGKAWLLLIRLRYVEKMGLCRRNCVISTLYETALMIASGLLLSLASFWVFYTAKGSVLLATGAMVIGILILFHPRVFYTFFNLVLKKFKKETVPEGARLKTPDLLRIILYFFISWAFGGISFYFLMKGITPVAWRFLPEVASVFIAANVIGFIAFFAPSGIGVREGMQIILLATIVPKDIAVLAAILARLLATTTEGILWLALHSMKSSSY